MVSQKYENAIKWLLNCHQSREMTRIDPFYGQFYINHFQNDEISRLSFQLLRTDSFVSVILLLVHFLTSDGQKCGKVQILVLVWGWKGSDLKIL